MGKSSKNSEINDAEVPRRKLFSWFVRLFVAAACIEFSWITGSILRSRKARALKDGKTVGLIDVGMADQFETGVVTAVPRGQFYLVRLEDGSFIALSRTCSHLGCSVPWDDERGKFVCPCHGSTFDQQGLVVTSPAVRPLDYYPVKIENGLVRVDVSKPQRREGFDISQTASI